MASSDVRNRIMYASRSVQADGQQLQRVQTLGSTSTFASTDVYELGQLDIVSVTDDTPSVAVTLETNAYNDIGNLATLFKTLTTGCVTRGRMSYTHGGGTATLTGIALQDIIQNEAGVHLVSAIQDETKAGVTSDNTVDFSLFLRDCFVNSFEVGLRVGDNATENYGLETDWKQWTLGSGRFISTLTFQATGSTGPGQLAWASSNFTTGGAYTEILALDLGVALVTKPSGYQFMRLGSGAAAVIGVGNTLEVSNGKNGFLIVDDNGAPSVEAWDNSAGKYVLIPVVARTTAVDPGTAATMLFIGSGISGHLSEKVETQTTAGGKSGCLFAFQVGTSGVFLGAPSGATINGIAFRYDGGLSNNDVDYLRVITAGNTYSSVNTSAMLRANEYFDETAVSGLGALRQGQIEFYFVDKNGSLSGVSPTLRVQEVTYGADLTREALNQLGNLKPYYRPVTVPIPVTVTITTIADDLTNFAKFCGLITTDQTIADLGATVVDISIADLLSNKNSTAVAYLYYQTDEDAGGTHASRKWKATTTVKYADGSSKEFTAGTREIPQKVIVAHNLYATDESETISVGTNQDQTFTFAARNQLFVVDTHALGTAEFERFEDHITTLTVASE